MVGQEQTKVDKLIVPDFYFKFAWHPCIYWQIGGCEYALRLECPCWLPLICQWRINWLYQLCNLVHSWGIVDRNWLCNWIHGWGHDYRDLCGHPLPNKEKRQGNEMATWLELYGDLSCYPLNQLVKQGRRKGGSSSRNRRLNGRWRWPRKRNWWCRGGHCHKADLATGWERQTTTWGRSY